MTRAAVERPGAYLRGMREAAGLTQEEAARLIELLGMAAVRSRPWFRYDVWQHLANIEADNLQPTREQLLSLTVIFPFSLSRYRELAAARAAVRASVAINPS